MTLPGVVCTMKCDYELRGSNIKGVMKANKTEIPIKTPADLGLEAGKLGAAAATVAAAAGSPPGPSGPLASLSTTSPASPPNMPDGSILPSVAAGRYSTSPTSSPAG